MRIFTHTQTLWVLFFLFSGIPIIHAQEQKSPMQIADSYFYQEAYARAIPYYLTIARKKNPSMDALLKLGYSYKETNKYEDAEKWYAKAHVLYADKMPAEAHKEYGEVLQNNKKINEAKQQFERYLSKGRNDNLNVNLASVDSVARWVENPDKRFKIKNAEHLNTSNDEWGATYNEAGIVFASNRLITLNDDRSGKSFYKLYFNPHSKPTIEPYSAVINQNKFHVGPIAFSKNNDTLYFTRTNVNAGGLKLVTTKNKEKVGYHELELFYQLKNAQGIWSNPQPFAYNNPKLYSLGHATLSSNGNTIYFVSDMDNGYGQTDIYYCEKKADGSWDTPVNCGATINTAGKEMFPTIVVENGKEYLYFSTDGRPTVGGLDIYKAQGQKNTWTTAVNLKIPVNSTRDDYYYVTKDGKEGYFSSNRLNGAGGDDIYAFYKTPGNEEQTLPASPKKRIVTLSGFVMDKDTRQVIGEEVQVNLINDKTKQELICLSLNGKQYVFEIEKGQSYTLKATAKSYLPEEREYFTSNITDTAYTYRKDISLAKRSERIQKIEEQVNLILKNIYYDLDKYNIRPDAAIELDKIVKILKEHPSIKVELGSHTDCRASSTYNMRLSENRAKAAVKYIVQHGIDASRLVAQGYGETRPLNACSDGVKCSEEQHQQNRRTEFRILSE